MSTLFNVGGGGDAVDLCCAKQWEVNHSCSTLCRSLGDTASFVHFVLRRVKEDVIGPL